MVREKTIWTQVYTPREEAVFWVSAKPKADAAISLPLFDQHDAK